MEIYNIQYVLCMITADTRCRITKNNLNLAKCIKGCCMLETNLMKQMQHCATPETALVQRSGSETVNVCQCKQLAVRDRVKLSCSTFPTYVLKQHRLRRSISGDSFCRTQTSTVTRCETMRKKNL